MIDKKWKQQNEGAYWAMQPGECEEDREARLRHYHKEEATMANTGNDSNYEPWPYHPMKRSILTKNEWLSIKLDGIVSAYLEIQDRANIIGNIVDDIKNECPHMTEDGIALINRVALFGNNIREMISSRANLIGDVHSRADELIGED